MAAGDPRLHRLGSPRTGSCRRAIAIERDELAEVPDEEREYLNGYSDLAVAAGPLGLSECQGLVL
jgi:hypothetical protein